MRTKTRSIAAGLAIAVAVASAPAARADDTERVQELEQRLAQMERLLEDIQERGGYAAGYGSELEARVAGLEELTAKDGKGLFWTGAGGSGAWEIAGRFSTLDLNDGAILGGEVDVITIGLNWYLNRNTRVMLNLQDIDLDQGGADKVQAVQVPFQIDF